MFNHCCITFNTVFLYVPTFFVFYSEFRNKILISFKIFGFISDFLYICTQKLILFL